jgi:hypothetical protein
VSRALPDSFAVTLARLRQSRAPDAREQMEEAAVRYIEGAPFDGQSFTDAPFVPDPSALPAPFPRYPEVYRLAANAPCRDPGEVIAEIWRAVGFPCEQAGAHLASTGYAQALMRVWQSYFALVVGLGCTPILRGSLAELLVVDHLLRWLSSRCGAPVAREQLERLASATIILPASIFPLPPRGASPVITSPPDPTACAEWIIPYAIGDLQMVKQRLVRYALGELAEVQSVMAGERRKSTRRSANRVTQSSAKLSADESVRTTSTRQATLTSEVKGTIEDTRTTATYNNFSTTYGPPSSKPNDPPSSTTPPAPLAGAGSTGGSTRSMKPTS